MSLNAENPSAAAEFKTAGAEPHVALLNLAHGIMAVAEEPRLTYQDLERLHNLGLAAARIAAELMSEERQGKLKLGLDLL